jgi:hypothetical protein
MNYHNRITIQRKFFLTGCKDIKFEGCEQLHQRYEKAKNAPGCSACAQRRAKTEFAKELHQKLLNLDFDSTLINPS